MLSARSALILRLISEGRSYEQILSIRPELTYLDIFSAAREALDTAVFPASETAETRAGYGRWNAAEDAELAHLVAGGEGADEIAARLRRHPDAVRARMMRLNLFAD